MVIPSLSFQVLYADHKLFTIEGLQSGIFAGRHRLFVALLETSSSRIVIQVKIIQWKLERKNEPTTLHLDVRQ